LPERSVAQAAVHPSDGGLSRAADAGTERAAAAATRVRRPRSGGARPAVGVRELPAQIERIDGARGLLRIDGIFDYLRSR
ncbi:unnamed protein product, partial [Urochloa humidicola]